MRPRVVWASLVLVCALLAACDVQAPPVPIPTEIPVTVAPPGTPVPAQIVSGAPVTLSDGKIVLGIINDQSGIYSALGGKNAVVAVSMAVEDFKAKYGANGLGPIEVMGADHQNDPDIAASKARDLYEKNGADVILDVPTSAAALAVAKVAAADKRLYINVSGATPDLTGAQCNKYTFHYAFDSYALSVGTGAWGAQHLGKKWFLLYPGYTYGADINKLFVAAVQAGGGTVLASEPSPFPNMSGDFSTQLSKAAGMNPDVVAAMQTGSDLQNLVKQFNGSPLKAQGAKLALGLLFESDISLIGPDALEGAVYTTPWLWTQDAEARVFAERWMARTGTRPTFAQAGSYSAAWQYLDAVRRAGTDDPDAVVKALEGYKFSDFFIRNGLIRAEDHFVAHDLLVAQIKTQAERKEPGDNAKVIGVVAADSSARPVATSGCTMPR